MLVYLIRHGETDLNKNHMLQGQMDIKLNEKGIDLAQKTGAAMKDIEFDVVISSSLSRAYDTAKILLGERQIEIKTDDRIREISFGAFEGLCYSGCGCNVPDPDFINFFVAPHLYKVPENGESFEDVIKRTGEFWKELIEDHSNKDKTVLVSTHGCALKGILANLNGTALAEFWGTGVHKNCGVTLVQVSEEGGEIIYEGKTFY